MILRPSLRSLVLTVHVTSTLGWLGGAATFLALSAVALRSGDPVLIRAVLLAADPIMTFVLIPFAVGALVSGVVQGLGTPWGLLRHYWVVFKLVLTALGALVMLQYAPTVRRAAAAAATGTLDTAVLPSYLLHAGGGLVLLLTATVLSIYKPPGLTPLGRRTRGRRPPAG